MKNANLAIKRRRDASGHGSDCESSDLFSALMTSRRFGEELYRLRTAAGLRQADVARRSGLTRGYYSQLENSKRFPPPLPTLSRIMSTLQLSPPQSKNLRRLAEAERCAMVVLPEEIPTELAMVVRRLAANVCRLSSQQLCAIAAVLNEVPAM